MKQVSFLSKNQSVFSRWTNKAFAVLNSMHREVKIATLALSYIMLVMPFEAAAQNDTIITDRKIDLDEVIVSAQRNPVTHSQTARIVSIVTKEELKNASVQTIDDLLRFLPNVDLRQRGKHGVQADVKVRGGSFDQTLILLNGINITDPQTGHHNLNLPVELEDIERIEVLEGPASKVLGPNAFTGAINFITGTKDYNSVSAHIMYGENDLYKTKVGATLSTGKLKSYISAGTKGSDGFTKNTDFETYNAFYHGQLETASGKLDMQLGFTDKTFGSNSFYTPKYPNQYEKTRTYFGSVKYSTGEKVKFTPSVYWRRNYDNWQLTRENPDLFQNFHASDVYGANLNASFSTLLGKTAVGVDFRNSSIVSTNLGFEMKDKIDVPGHGGKQYTKQYSRTNVSYFLEHSLYLNRFIASAGVMANVNSDLPREINWMPGAELAYFIVDDLKVFVSANSAMRMPTFTDLFYVDPTFEGNVDLKPEKSVTYEVGFKFQNKFMRSHINYFKRYGTDIIDWLLISAEEGYQSTNYDVNAQGVTVSAELFPQMLFGENSPLHHVKLSYTKMDQEELDENIQLRYGLNYLKNKFNASAEFRLPFGLGLNTQVGYYDRAGKYTKWLGDSFETTSSEFKPYWLVDARLFFTYNYITAYVECSNLFDTDYADIANVPQPGRWIVGGVKLNFNFK